MHSVGLNYIFPYRFSYEDNSIVKIWLRSQNSGNAALGIPIIHYQRPLQKVSPAKSVGKKFGT